jgi:hypothetical protein
MPVASPLPPARSQSGEESRALLQRRLAQFFGWFSVVLLCLLASNAVATAVVGPRTGISGPAMRTAYPVLTTVCVGIFVACWRRRLSARTLRAVDVGASSL